ncbi:thymidylate synthase [Candidatus Marinamargulisbacteria bacterium SCGC AAA071-K20]|nr:thymidylate synthase [Candidatus Marinamargulisbacteria bacterium SCGC AAA071-K20]
MKQYLDLLKFVLENGEEKGDRTGTGTISHFGSQLRFDLREGFPLLTTKKVLFSSILHELLWFLKGSTNIYEGLNPHTKIWDAWADKDGNLGPVYGYQWRNWEKFTWDKKENKYTKSHVDQIKEVIKSIKTNPDSRRHIVSAWNVADIDRMALPPCHSFFQFYVMDGHLDCQLYQRSADIALGVPFNIASYALFLMMIAQECNLTPRYFVHTFGDVHIYQNHVEGVKEQLTRSPGELPQVKVAKKTIFELTFEDFEVQNYDPQAFIKFPIAV